MKTRGVACAVVALTAGTVSAQLSDDFESYASGSTLGGQGAWAVWCTGGVDATVSTAFAHSGSRSVRVDTLSDLVADLGSPTAGRWVFTAWTYVPSSASGTGEINGFINLMNTYCDGALQTMNWSTATKFSRALGLVQTWNFTGSAPLALDRWAEYRVEIDLDTDTFDEYYDGALILAGASWTNNVGFGGPGVLRIAAVDLFSESIDGMYFDDVSLTPEGGGCDCVCNYDTSTGGDVCDFFDFITFQDLFAGGDPCGCELDTSTGTGVCDFFDFIIFQDLFSVGC